MKRISMKVKVAIMSSLALMAGTASAAIPLEVTAAFGVVTADVAEYSGLVIAAIITVSTALLSFRLLKRFISKAV